MAGGRILWEHVSLPTTVEKRNTTGIHTDAKYEHLHEWNKGKASDEMATITCGISTLKTGKAK